MKRIPVRGASVWYYSSCEVRGGNGGGFGSVCGVGSFGVGRGFVGAGRRSVSGRGSGGGEVSFPWLVGGGGRGGGAGSLPEALGVSLRTATSSHSPGAQSLWGALKQRNAEQMGRHFAAEHLGNYDFSAAFQRDASRTVAAFVTAIDSLGRQTAEHALNNDSDNDSDSARALLDHVATPKIADAFIAASTELAARNLRAELKLLVSPSSTTTGATASRGRLSNSLSHLNSSNASISALAQFDSSVAVDMPKSQNSKALLASDPRFINSPILKSRITSWHWIFGPCPPPEDHIYQHWLNFYTVVIPAAHADKMEYHELKDIKQAAIDAGIFVRIYVTVDAPIEFSLVDVRTGIPVFRDTRPSFDIQFTSPHFTPWDDVLEPYAPANGVPMGTFGGGFGGAAGLTGDDLQKNSNKAMSASFWKANLREEEWRLRWDWKVCDVDYLNYVPIGHSVNLWGHKGNS